MRRVLIPALALLAHMQMGSVWAAPKEVTDAEVRMNLPPALKRFLEFPPPHTSQIEWTLSWSGGYDDGLVERYVTQSVDDTVLQSNLGDENRYYQIGFHSAPPRGLPLEELGPYMVPREQGAGTNNSLILDDHVWNLNQAETSWTGMVASLDDPQGLRPFDFSAAGMAVGTNFEYGLLGLWPSDVQGFESATFSSYPEGRFNVVVAEYNNRRIEWYLDTSEGGLPVHAAFYRNGEPASSTETEYGKTAGSWFPTTVRFYLGDDLTPFKVIEVQQASFDEPWHKQEITLEDIGPLMFGSLFWGWDGQERRWDGTQIVSAEQYDELVYIYGLRPDRRILEDIAASVNMTAEEYLAEYDLVTEARRDEYYKRHGEAPWLTVESDEKDEWDVYVETFIEKHKLDKIRIRYAHDILKRAKRLRDTHRRKNIREIRKAERTGDEEKLAYYKAVTKRIFDKVLVRGLNKLVPPQKEKKRP